MSETRTDRSGQESRPRVIVGVSGASGAAYGRKALALLRSLDVETHLIVSQAAQVALSQELGESGTAFAAHADVNHSPKDIGAAPASGSFRTRGMIVAPCSVRTMSEIATGATSSLLTRAADVTLKERRPLVLLVRETPLHLGHLRTLCALAEMGAIIMPPVPAMYAAPQSLDDLVTQTVARALDFFGFDAPETTRWTGLSERAS